MTGGGTLSSFTGSGTTYTATLTPSTEGLQSIKVASGVYTDLLVMLTLNLILSNGRTIPHLLR